VETPPSAPAERLVLRTERLELVPFAREDAPLLHGLLTDPAVRRFLLDDEVVTLEWVEGEVEASLASFERHAYGLWKLLLASGEVVGFAGYREFREPPELELLYGLLPGFWGRGLATEAAAALIRYGFEELGFERVRASTDAQNAASIRLMERLGMRFSKREERDGLDTIGYELERGRWRR
jgi:[ribosomal protein S5]-alanine N-acetyltransferase